MREDAIRAQVKNDRLSSGLERQRLGGECVEEELEPSLTYTTR